MGLRRHDRAISGSTSSSRPHLSPGDDGDYAARVDGVIGSGGTSDDPRSSALGEWSPETVAHRPKASRRDVRRSAASEGTDHAGYRVGATVNPRHYPCYST